MSKEIVISVKNVSKSFKLPHEKADSVKSLFVNPFNQNRKKFEVQHALRNISFDIKKGEFFGIVGRNGSGKSTLLKIIAGIYQPNKGNVVVDGKIVPFIELGVGFNPQLTGRENVYLNGALLGFSEKEVDLKYKEIVDFAELDRFMDQKLRNYSSGMQVRLAFSVATILAESDILLIDEVLAVGDADFQRKCFNYFRHLKKLKKTVVFVSHDMESIREYCDRCVFINDAEIVYDGSPEKAAEMYLAMFNESGHIDKVTNKSTIENVSRWGDGSAHFDDIKIENLSEKEIKISTEISFLETIEQPIVGIQITNSMGQPVCGTNNKILRKNLESVKAGQKITCVWTIPNIFSSGNYTVDVAVTHHDGVTQADWWHEATDFKIINELNTSHIVSPIIGQDFSL